MQYSEASEMRRSRVCLSTVWDFVRSTVGEMEKDVTARVRECFPASCAVVMCAWVRKTRQEDEVKGVCFDVVAVNDTALSDAEWERHRELFEEALSVTEQDWQSCSWKIVGYPLYEKESLDRWKQMLEEYARGTEAVWEGEYGALFQKLEQT